MDLRKTPNSKLRVVLLNIMKRMSKIGPFRKPLVLYSAPPSLSREEATRWVKGIPQGEIGGLEVFLSENEVSIQLVNFDNTLLKDKRNKESSFIDSIPSQLQETESFHFFLKKPSIYSIFQENTEGWLNDLDFIDGEAWIQVLFQKDKHDKWGEILKQQYEDYLKGISYPSTIVPIRKLQLKIAEISRNINVFEKTVMKTENRFPILQFLPHGTLQEETLLLDHFEKELNGAIEKLGVIKEEGIQIIGFEQGPTLIHLNILLPKGIRLSDLQKVIADWQTELGITDLSVFQGKEKGTGTLTLPRKNRQAVYLRNLVDTKEFKSFAEDKVLPFVIGATETGEPMFEDLTRVKHLLVAVIDEFSDFMMQDKDEGIPTKGVPQGGILSPLLSNIVLNELDWWISDQWETFKSNHPYKHNGSKVQALKKSNLKEGYIVRYADDCVPRKQPKCA